MRTAFLLVPTLLAACSDSDSSSVAAPQPPSVQITSANAVLVARTALRASLGLADVTILGADLVTILPPGPPAQLGLPAPALHGLGEPTAGEALPVLVSTTIPGTEGGEVVRTWDDRDQDERVSTGDVFALDFAAFGEAGLVLDGAMQFDAVDVDGDLQHGLSWIFGAHLHFLDLSVTAAAVTETLRGSLRCTREKRATVMTLDLEVDQGFTADDMQLEAGNMLAYHEYVLDFSFAQFGHGAVESEAIGGLVEFESTVPFTGMQVLPDPSIGELEVRGKGGSLLTIRAVDFFNFEILLDADGDGVAEETIPMPWSAP